MNLRQSEIDRLLQVSSPALGVQLSAKDVVRELGDAYDALASLLEARNGLYAFHRALHVFPLHSNGQEQGLIEWNVPTVWRVGYPYPPASGVFFAENIFGSPFWTEGRHVCLMEDETGELNVYADSLEEWLYRVLNEDDAEIGTNLARNWSAAHAELLCGQRLAPKTPFLLQEQGSELALSSFYAANTLQLMRFRGDLATRLKDIPDGTKIQVKVIP